MAVTITGDVVRMTADGDLFPAADAQVKPNYHVKNVVVAGATSGKFYRLRNGAVDGGVFWDSISGDAPFPTGGNSLYLETDDAGTAFAVMVYLG